MTGLRSTHLTFFHILWLFLICLCTAIGIAAGGYAFGTIGKITGGIAGFVIGFLAGAFADDLIVRQLFREVEGSSNEKLRTMVASEPWNFRNTLALLQLGAREQEVDMELPRILGMLESDSKLTRIYGWDALRLVFTEEYYIIEDYNPRSSTEECRRKTEILKTAMKKRNDNGSATQPV